MSNIDLKYGQFLKVSKKGMSCIILKLFAKLKSPKDLKILYLNFDLQIWSVFKVI